MTRIGLAAALLLASQQKAPPAPKIDPAKVDAAVKAGVEFLRMKLRKQPAAAANQKELVLLTLVHAGVKKGDLLFDELLKSILEEDLKTTYRVALQAKALEEIDRAAHQKRIIQCAQFLVDNQCQNGQWSYGDPTAYPDPTEYTGTVPAPAMDGKPPVQQWYLVKKQKEGKDRGDNSNAQFALLGLRSCRDAGIVLPAEVVKRATEWWRECQHGSPGKGEGPAAEARGWNYGPKGNAPYGSMTAGAVSALAICHYLAAGDWKKDDAIHSGLNWLRDNFTVTENPGRHGQHLHYYLYALERAGTLTGTARFGRFEWYPEGAQFLLATQVNDGSWEKNTVDTCFAILFLQRSTRPIPETRMIERSK